MSPLTSPTLVPLPPIVSGQNRILVELGTAFVSAAVNGVSFQEMEMRFAELRSAFEAMQSQRTQALQPPPPPPPPPALPLSLPEPKRARVSDPDRDDTRHDKMHDRFVPTPAWCNVCEREHPFTEFLLRGKGISFMCCHDYSDMAEKQNKFFRNLMKDPVFPTSRRDWGAIGRIIKHAIENGLYPGTCALEVDVNLPNGARFVES